MSDQSTASDAHAVDESQEQLIPSRFRLLKRFSIAGLLLLVGLVGLRFWWGHVAQSRLDRLIARYRAAGEPVTIADFVAAQPEVPEENNAAILIQEAASKIVTLPEVNFHYFATSRPGDRSHHRARPLLDANEPALNLIRRARGCQQVLWDAQLDSPATQFTPLNGLRTISELLNFAASYHVVTQNHAAAIATMRDSLAFSEAVGAHPATIWFMTSTACHGGLFALIKRYAHELPIDPITTGEPTTGGCREEAVALLTELLDESRMRTQAIRAQLGTRASTIHQAASATYTVSLGPGIPASLTWPPLAGAADWLARPMVVLDYAANAELSNLTARAMAEPNWPRAKARIPLPAEESAILRRLTQPAARSPWAVTRFERVMNSAQLLFRTLANRRMAAIALAIRLYEVDHGARPEKLADLAPDYLPALPQDPFSAEGATFQYVADPDRPQLISVGVDGVLSAARTAGGLALEPFDDDNIVFKLKPFD